MPVYVAIVGVGDSVDIMVLVFLEMKFKNSLGVPICFEFYIIVCVVIVIFGVLDSNSHGK